MPNESNLWLPSHLRPARKATRVVFWKWRFCKNHPSQKCSCADIPTRIEVGAKEEYSRFAPPNVEVIVCESASEVDKYDRIMRQQDQDDDEITNAKRDAIEGEIRRQARADLYNRMVNSPNAINREFCRLALRKMDAWDEAQKKEKRETYMHIVAFEDGK